MDTVYNRKQAQSDARTGEGETMMVTVLESDTPVSRDSPPEPQRKKELAERIKAARASTGLTQMAFCVAIGWGEQSQPRLSTYETGDIEPGLAEICLIAKFTHMDARMLAFGPAGQGLTLEEDQLVNMYRRADVRGKRYIKNAALVAVEK